MSGDDLNKLRVLSEMRISLELGELRRLDLDCILHVCKNVNLKDDGPLRRSFFLLVEDFFQRVLTKMLKGGCVLNFKDVIGSLFTHIGKSLDIVQFDVDGCRWFGGKAVMECLLCAGNSDRIRIVSIMLIGAVILNQGSSCCSSLYFVNSLSRFYASTQEFTHDLLNSDDRLLLTVLALLELERHIPEDSIFSPFRVILMIFIDIDFDHNTVLGWIDSDSMGLPTVLHILTNICSKDNFDKWLQAGGFKRRNRNKRYRLDSGTKSIWKDESVDKPTWLIDECMESSKDIIITLNIPTSSEYEIFVKKEYTFMKREPTRIFTKPSRLSLSSQFSKFELMVNMFIELQLLLNLRTVDIDEDMESPESKELRTQLTKFFDYLDIELDLS